MNYKELSSQTHNNINDELYTYRYVNNNNDKMIGVAGQGLIQWDG